MWAGIKAKPPRASRAARRASRLLHDVTTASVAAAGPQSRAAARRPAQADPTQGDATSTGRRISSIAAGRACSTVPAHSISSTNGRRCRPSPATRHRSSRPGCCRSRRRRAPPSDARPSAPTCRRLADEADRRHRRPTAWQGRAAIAGEPGRSTRRNRMPEPSAAGRSVTATLAPLWRPTPAQPID